WLLLLTLSLLPGGAAGLALERLLLLVLKPVLPAALPPPSGWPWLWAVGATGVISLLVALRPYRLLLATLPLRVLRQDVVANVLPLKIWIPTVSAVVVGLLAWL
ncbi:ABC transporter permease, partial [Klebsiella quasipneumoniae]|nr:ABC transporter permease [Klebsiella quasipneumoniae]